MAAQKEAIEEAVNVIKNCIENKIAQNTERLIRAEIEQVLKQEFLEALTHKVEQISQAKVVSREFSEHFINLGCEIPKIDPSDTQIPHQVIKGIEAVNLEYFLKRKQNYTFLIFALNTLCFLNFVIRDKSI